MFRIRFVVLLLSLWLPPARLWSQDGATLSGACGKTSWSPEEVRILYADLFIEEDEEELRKLWGIRQVPENAPVYAETDQRRCNELMHPLREGLRLVDDGTRLNSYVLSFLRIGDYYVIVLGLPEGSAPAGYMGRTPLFIVDGRTMKFVTRILG